MKFKRIYLLLKKELEKTNILNYAAQISYGLMLAFLPLLMLLSLVLNLVFKDKGVLSRVIPFISEYLPAQFADLIVTSIQNNRAHLQVTLSSSTAVNVALIFFIVYSVIRLFKLIMIVFTKIAGMKETRNFIHLWVLATVDLISALFLITLSTYLYIETRVLLIDFATKYIGTLFRDNIEAIYNKFIYVYIVVVLFCVVNWILATFPAQKFKYHEALPGTFFVLIGWSLIIALINFINDFFVYEGFISLLDQGIVIMVTVYLVSLVLLIGFLINNALRKLRERHPKYLKTFIK